jgi:fused signal recognition particle receptor
MFKFLKDKIKGAVESFSKKAPEEDVHEETLEKEKKPTPKQPPKQQKKESTTPKPTPQPQKKKPTPTKQPQTPAQKPQKPAEEDNSEKVTAEQEQKKGFFTRLSEKITTIELSEEQFDDLFWDLEIGLLENNVAVEVIEKIKADLKEELTTGRTGRGGLQERILRRLEETLQEILSTPTIDLLASAEEHQPLIIAAVGVNGSGKTTSLAKLGRYFQDNNKSVLFAACDTFRAAAIQQLQEHAKNLNAPIIKQDYGADAAAVAYDAVQAAKARNLDVVLIDTAGRLHSNKNLMDELAKVMRVAKPHHTLFVGEATTGNDCVEQAKQFQEQTNIDGIILTKADVDEQGGAAISISYVTQQPILFLGIGQGYDDLEAFDKQQIIKQVLANE